MDIGVHSRRKSFVLNILGIDRLEQESLYLYVEDGFSSTPYVALIPLFTSLFELACYAPDPLFGFFYDHA